MRGDSRVAPIYTVQHLCNDREPARHAQLLTQIDYNQMRLKQLRMIAAGLLEFTPGSNDFVLEIKAAYCTFTQSACTLQCIHTTSVLHVYIFP